MLYICVLIIYTFHYFRRTERNTKKNTKIHLFIKRDERNLQKLLFSVLPGFVGEVIPCMDRVTRYVRRLKMKRVEDNSKDTNKVQGIQGASTSNRVISIKFLPSSLIGQIESCPFVNVYVNRIFIKAEDAHTYIHMSMCAPLYLACCNCRFNNEIGLMLMRLPKLVIPENAVSHCEKRIEECELQPVTSTLPWIGSRPIVPSVQQDMCI